MVCCPCKHRARIDLAALGLEPRPKSWPRKLPAGARPGPLPAFIEPSLALLAERPPRGPQWVRELEFDGYRSNDTSFHRQGDDRRRYRRIERDMRPISELELERVLARRQTQHGLRLPAAEMPVLVLHRDGLLQLEWCR
jgi:hypothetical protein